MSQNFPPGGAPWRGTRAAGWYGKKRPDCTCRHRWRTGIEWVLVGVCTAVAAQRLKLAVFEFRNPTPMASPSLATSDMPASYEAALQELEQLLVQMEAGDLPLEQLSSSYKRGAELLKYCRDKLEAVEDQIKVLDQGVLKSWTPE